MEPTQENFNALVYHIAESINPLPERRNKGEEFLKNASTQPGFLLLLLRLQEVKTVDPSLRLGAALHFKNFVRANWSQVGDDFVPISDSDRAQIKAVLVDLMLSVESNISKTLAEALSIISETEFPHDWPTLLPQLVSKFGSQDWSIINGVLETIHSILRRYRHQFRSETILGELKYILTQLQKPYHDLFLITMQAIATNINNPDALKTLFVTANLLCKIFYSLNAVDLPEYFEDNMASFMDAFRKFLHFQTTFPALLEGAKEDSPGLLHKIQANVCNNLNLYIEKYEEEVKPFLDALMQDVWTLLSKTDNSPKVDRLVNAMIQFLTSVAKSVYHTLFAAETTLKEICAFVVIPNMKLRESDIEIFEDNPAEYIRRDSEGSDTDTRRRAALELVKGLRKHYEARVTTMFSADITQMLSAKDWISKDTAIYLVTALAVKSSTSAAGTTAVNEMVPIPDFCRSQILPELQGTTRSPVLRATSIKFITTFRQQLPVDVYTAALPHLIALMRDPNYVIHSYAATCVERLLTVKDNQVLRIGQLTNDFIGSMLANLFEALSYKDSQENEYTMRAITRVISVSGANITPFAPTCLQKLVEILIRVAQNSTNPTFAHYVFESLGSLVKNTCAQNPTAVTQFEGVLFPVFQSILEKDINELMELAKTKRLSELSELEGAHPTPYILQILSLLLELSPVPISGNYAQLFPPLLLVVMWERKSNVPALIRIVQAYLRKGPSIVVSGKHLPAILGIFQNKFNKSKVHDHEGFYLLEAIVENLSLPDIDPYLPAIFQEIFGRLGNEKTKTLKYVKSFLVFLSLFIGKHGPTAVISRVDAIQPNIFAMVLNSLYIPNIGKVNGKIERKICCVAMVKLLTESPELLSTYAQFWSKVAAALLGVIELPEDDSVQHGEFAEEDDEMEHFSSAAFSPLSFAAKSDVDPFPGVNPKLYLATQLSQLIQTQPQVVQLLAGLEPQAREAIKQYFQLAALPPPAI
eukprot:Phypoly_transcript_01435.p1 GENE.Phypoly_transcript_01435~~Phypoly_transcript_01435.p1  ORF type:complete len:984 (+),score=185.73 Phypoly_transcript_01435:58-3009(+)